MEIQVHEKNIEDANALVNDYVEKLSEASYPFRGKRRKTPQANSGLKVPIGATLP